jgi:DNA mismatch repair ATPase MutS
MENNAKIRAYCYYKEQYPQPVIFFRVGNDYEAYLEDAVTVSKMVSGIKLEQTKLGNIIKFSISQEFDYISSLASYGITIKTINQRNQIGNFDVPDVDLIINDKEIDY